MTPADIPEPPRGTGADAGVVHYARHLVSSPDPLRAAGQLQNWIADRIGDDDEPQDFGRLYVIFAELGDVQSMVGDKQTAAQAVRRAASEWVGAASDQGERSAWFERWNVWLRHHSEGRPPLPG